MPIRLASGTVVFTIGVCGPAGAGKKTILSMAIENYTRIKDHEMESVKERMSNEGGSACIVAPQQNVAWRFHVVNMPGDGQQPDGHDTKLDALLFIFDREANRIVDNERCIQGLDVLVREAGVLAFPRDMIRNTPFLVCMNKSDAPAIVDESIVKRMFQELERLNPLFIETVAFANINVKRALAIIQRDCLVRHYNNQYPPESFMEVPSLTDIDPRCIHITLHNGSKGDLANVDGFMRPPSRIVHEDVHVQPPTTHPADLDGIFLTHDEFNTLKKILEDAVDIEELKKIMGDMGFNRTIFIENGDEIARYLGFRVQSINKILYILCPIHFLYDPDTGTETGFAIDVNQDHFHVYPYMFKPGRNEYRVLSALPHCVYRAITLDGNSLKQLGEERVQIANVASAKFFINSLVVDLTSDVDSPAEFFDDKLYIQILNRLVTVKDPAWVNPVAITNKFDQLMAQLQTLDKDDQLHANNKRRVFLNIVQFLFGIPDLVQSRGFLKYLTTSVLRRHEQTIRKHLETSEFIEFVAFITENWSIAIDTLVFLFNEKNLPPSRDFLRDMSVLLFTMLVDGKMDTREFLRVVHRCHVDLDESQVHYIFKRLILAGDLGTLHDLATGTGIVPEREAFVAACNRILQQGDRFNAFDSQKLIGLLGYGGYVPEERVGRELFAIFLKRETFDVALPLYEYLKIQMDVDYRTRIYQILMRKDLSVQENKDSMSSFMRWLVLERDELGIIKAMTAFVLNDETFQASQLCSMLNIVPDERMAKHFYGALFQSTFQPNHVNIVRKLISWTGIGPDPGMIQGVYQMLLREGKVSFINGLYHATRVTPDVPREVLAEIGIDQESFKQRVLRAPIKSAIGKTILKIYLGGDGGVGACTFAHRFVSDVFVPDTKLCLSEIFVKNVTVDGNDYVLSMWRMGAQERFRFLQKSYVRGAVAAILFFDMTRLITLYSLEGSWLPIIRNEDPDMPVFLVGTKMDLLTDDQRHEMEAIVADFASTTKIDMYCMTSAKTGHNIESIMEHLVKVTSRRILG